MKVVVIMTATFALFLAGCNSASEPTTPEATSAATPAAPDVPIPPGPVSPNYIDAADALYNGDFDRAKTSLTSLAAETTGELQTRAQAAASAADLAAMRKAFKELSDIAAHMELPPDHSAASCPMYQPGSRSLWVQKRGTLANPYYGKSDAMSSCGAFVN